MLGNGGFTFIAIVIGILAALLALVVLFFLFLMLRRAVRSSNEAKSPSPAAQSGSPPAAMTMIGASKQDLARAFAQALRRLKALTAAYGWRYSTPWYLMLGEKDAGKSTILGSLSALRCAGEQDSEAVPGQPLSWHFFNQGVVLDIAGRIVLGSDAQPADERSWRHILKLLTEHRPQRPADGIIVTIPCSDFMGPDRLNSDALLAKADQMRHRLIELEQKFGLQLPVYVIVSKCDLIAGFQSFWREIAPLHRTEIFGWSNARELDSEVTPADFDGEFGGVAETLYRLHLEIAGRERNAADPEGALLFPSEFERLRDSLRLYCLGLFRRDVYHDAFFFRGVYFTGDGGPPAQMLLSSNLSPGPAAPVSPRVFPLFAQDLFARKILPEESLAAVARSGRVLRSRSVRIAAGILAAFVLIGGSGLTYAGLRLNRDSAALLQPISFIVQSTGRAEERERNAAQEPMNSADDARLLQMFARLNVRYLHSAWLPSSWFSSLDQRVIDHFSLGFDTVILDAMRRTLERRATAVTQEAAAGGPAPQGKSYALSGSPEGKRLVQYVDGLRQIEAGATIYNRLGTPDGTLADLEQLTNRLLNAQLPHDFFVDSDLYSAALHQVTIRPFDATVYRPQAVQELETLFPRLEHLMADDGPILSRFAGIPDSLDDLDRAGVTGVREMDQPLARLRDSLNFAQTALADRDFAWFSGERIDADPQFSQLLRQIASSAFLGPQAADELRQRGNQYLAAAQDQLTGISFQGSTQLIDRSGANMTFHAAPALNGLFAVVPKLLSRPFMTIPDSTALPDANTAATVVWDPGQLEQAITLENSYEQFVATDLQSVPAEFRRSIDTAARQRLETNIDAAIAKAEIPYTASSGAQTAEADLFFQTQAFARASQALGNILSVLSQNGLTRSYNQLRDFAGLQAYRLLQRIDQNLDAAQLYALRNDVRPQAQLATPMLASFGFRTEADLTQYLQGQRNRIMRLATTGAQPLVDFLTRSDFSSGGRPMPLLPKWQRIVLDVGEAENGAPANPVSELEDFLRVDLARVTRDNCADQLAPDRTGIAGDYFLDRRNALRQVLYAECLTSGRTGAAAAYAQLAERFNASLAGRFPFAPSSTNAPDAMLDAVTDYLRFFAASAPAVEKELTRQAVPAQRSAMAFLQQMDKVRTFFAAFPDAAPGELPGFDVTADFRVNRRYEAGADQIIGWELMTGDHLFQQGDAVKPFRWHVSDPVVVNLRWAKDGPVAPANGSSDRVVSWKYEGNWALLRLIEDRRARPDEIDSSAMLIPHVLKFAAETAPAGGAPSTTPSPAPVKQATAFIAVHLSSTPPGEKAPVNVVLPDFPVRAPALQGGGNIP